MIPHDKVANFINFLKNIKYNQNASNFHPIMINSISAKIVFSRNVV